MLKEEEKRAFNGTLENPGEVFSLTSALALFAYGKNPARSCS